MVEEKEEGKVDYPSDGLFYHERGYPLIALMRSRPPHILAILLVAIGRLIVYFAISHLCLLAEKLSSTRSPESGASIAYL